MSKDKKKQFERLCETQPHRAYLTDREAFVRKFNESRAKQGLSTHSKRQIEDILHNTRPD